MIDKVLDFLQQTAQSYIAGQLPGPFAEQKVVLTNFVDDAGKTQIPLETVGLSLLNIEQERTFRARPMGQLESQSKNTPKVVDFVHRPVDLNLQLMFTANFSNYSESLKHIGFIIQCFQVQPRLLLSAEDPEQDKLQLLMEINTLPLEQQHYIWSMVGLRYLPSVVYRLRMIRIQDTQIRIRKQTAQGLEINEQVKGVKD